MRISPALALLLAPLAAACANPRSAAAPPAQPTPEEQQAMMLAMMTAGTPGPEHAEFGALAGDWNMKVRMRMGPDEPWTESAGTAKFTKTLGGRYLVQKFVAKLDMGGMEMQLDGLEIFGFNNLTKQYEFWWFDTMGTSPVAGSGGKVDGVIDMRGVIRDAITPEGRPARFTHRTVDENHFFREGYDTIPPHGELKVMELEYTRVIP